MQHSTVDRLSLQGVQHGHVCSFPASKISEIPACDDPPLYDCLNLSDLALEIPALSFVHQHEMTCSLVLMPENISTTSRNSSGHKFASNIKPGMIHSICTQKQTLLAGKMK